MNVNRARRCVSSGWRRLLDQQLAAHAEVRDEGAAGRRAVRLGHRQPQVLAAPVRGGERAAGQGGDEVLGALEVPPDGPRVVHLDGGHRAPGDPLLQAAPDHLDLGQLRHGGLTSALGGQGPPGGLGGLLLGGLLRPARAAAVDGPGQDAPRR